MDFIINEIKENAFKRVIAFLKSVSDEKFFLKCLEEAGGDICHYEQQDNDVLRLIFSSKNMKKLAKLLYNNHGSLELESMVRNFFEGEIKQQKLEIDNFDGEINGFWQIVEKKLREKFPIEVNQRDMVQKLQRQNDERHTEIINRFDILDHQFAEQSKIEIKENWESWNYDTIEEMQKVIDYRAEEVMEVENMLASNPYVVLEGEPGIGKTILARAIVSKHEKTMWLDYQGTMRNTILMMASKLNINEEIKELSEKEKYKRICKELCNCHYHKKLGYDNYIYIVIDNCNGLQCFDSNNMVEAFINEFGEFCKNVIRCSEIKFILTTTFNHTMFRQVCFSVGAINQYVDFFKEQLGTQEDFNGLLEKIGEKVNYNTYITVLLAGLVQNDDYNSNEQILLNIFNEINENCLTNENEVVIDPQLKITGQHTLMEHIRRMYYKDHIDEKYDALLYHLSLAPQQGIDFSLFEKLYPADDYIGDKLKTMLSALRRYHWILMENNRIIVHSLVRELFINSQKQHDTQCERYCLNIMKEAKERKIKDIYKCFGIEPYMYEVYRIRSRKLSEPPTELDWIVAEVGYILTEIYEKTGMHYNRVYPIATRIVDAIIKYSSLDVSKQIKRVRMISGCAYSQLHTNTQDSQKKLEECKLAKKNLELAQNEAEKIPDDGDRQHYYEKEIVRALIHGNLGAYYITVARLEEDDSYYDRALREHTEGLKIREKLYEEQNNDSTLALIATSHYCIGVDYKGLHNYDDAIEELYCSFKIRNRKGTSNYGSVQSGVEIWRTILAVKEDEVADIIQGKIEEYVSILIKSADFYLENGDENGLKKMKDIMDCLSENTTVKDLMSPELYNNVQLSGEEIENKLKQYS